MKRKNDSDNGPGPKKIKIEETHVMKTFIIRNDDDPHVYINIDYDYVKIGDFIYKTKPFENGWDIYDIDINDMIGITASQYKNISKFVTQKKVLVSSFHGKVSIIKKLSLNLTVKSYAKIETPCNNLITHFHNFLKNQIVSFNQNILTNFDGVTICINIWDLDEYETMGKINSETEIYVQQFDDNMIITCNPIKVNSSDIKIYITSCISLHPNTVQFPLIQDLKITSKYVKTLLEKGFIDNDVVTYRDDNHEFTFNIKILTQKYKAKFVNTYKLHNDNGTLNIISTTDDIIITNGQEVAEKICFTISSKSKNFNNNILVVQYLIDYVKKNIKYITFLQTINYQYNNREVLLTVCYINPISDYQIKYKLTEQTIITFDVNTNSKFILVKNVKPLDITEITFKIKKEPYISLFSPKRDDKMYMLNKKKLKKIVRNLFPIKTALGQKIKVNYYNDIYIIQVNNIVFEENNVSKSKYAIQGTINKTTKIKFIVPRNSKNQCITISEKNEVIDKPVEELEKYVGGISDEIKKIVRSICLSRGILKTEFLARGLKPVKGIILHGPPGTGKTTLARNLGKLLGCDGDRFKLISGPEIFSKWVGASEANIREIFKPAKKAWEKYQFDSPMYMVVIDEIDAMIPHRNGGSSPVRDSVVNQFLAEMDGLVQFYNLICIGITNKLELLDPAATRAGRFGIHIKIDLPDSKARIDIFNIHTKKLKELNRLENIDFKKFSELTNNFSGADIESVVELASTYSLERLSELKVIDESAIESVGKVTRADFIKAIKEINTNNKNTTDCKVSYIYT